MRMGQKIKTYSNSVPSLKNEQTQFFSSCLLLDTLSLFSPLLYYSMPAEHNIEPSQQPNQPFPHGQPLPPPNAMFAYPPNYHGPYPPPPHGDAPQYYAKPFYILPPPSGLPPPPVYHHPMQMYPTPPPPPEQQQPMEIKQTKRKRQTQAPHYEVLELKPNTKGKRQRNNKITTEDEHCECDQVGGRMECDVCGASYAHPKCLAKHRWDRHMDRWSMVEGMLEMNKQQQVQMMEVRDETE